MSHPTRRLARYTFALLGSATFAACASGGTDATAPGAIVLGLSTNAASIQQGASAAVTGTVTRSGGFTGTVTLSVTGAPTGVTAVVSNMVTAGQVTTATITINVNAATVPGSYNLTARGTGSGVSETATTFALTVTAAPPPPAYTLSLSATTLSIVQGASTPTTTVTLDRTNFTGNVALSVENLPSGVTAAFNPPSPTTQNSSVLTLSVGAASPPGTYTTLLVRGTAAGLADRTAPLTLTIIAAPSFTLGSTPAGGVTLVQGTNDNSKTITIARTNYPGNITLTAEGLPPGVSATFAGNPVGGNTSVMTLTATAGAAVGGPVTVTVRGTGPASLSEASAETSIEATTTFSLTIAVAGNFSLTTTPSGTVSITQGTSTPTVTVNVGRSGGNTSSVALTATGTLPAGMTLGFAPASTTGASSVLTITTTGATPLGTYPIVIHGNATGLGEQLVNLSIVVTAPAAPANVTLTFASCTTANKAVWVAYQDGNGPWTRVTGVGDVYQFGITQSKGGIAYVVLGTGTSTVNVLYFSQAELAAGVLNFCAPAASGKTVNGTVVNLANNFSGANVSFGGVTKFVGNGAAFQLTDVRDGNNDVVGYSKDAFQVVPDRVVILRGMNPANGGSVGTMDFTGAGSFAPETGNMTLTITGGGGSFATSMRYLTGTGANACVAALLYTGNSNSISGVPVANQLPTDSHSLSVLISTASTTRGFSEDFRVFGTRVAQPFVVPTALSTVTVTNPGGPYKRLEGATTLPAEYTSTATFSYVDGSGATSVLVSATAAWLGGTAVTLGMPDFSATVGGGFVNTWAPGTSDAVTWTLTGAGSSLPACTDGHRVVFATRSGTG